MNGQVTMAQWLIENKNGKAWSKYGKERVYINVYVKGMQIDNFFYDVQTDRFFGCDSKTEKSIRNEYESATENKIKKLQKELETRQSMLRTQMKSKYASQEVIEENKKRIQELENEIKAETEEAITEETATEETTTEETATEEATIEEIVEETKEVTTETEAKTEIKATASKISNELQNRFKMKQKEAQKEEMEIFKNLTSNIKDNLEESEIKDIVTDKKISQFFQLQLLKYIYEEFQKWIPSSKMTGGNFGIVEFVKKYDRDYFVTDLVFNRNFEKLVKSIKDFIKKGGD